MKVYILEKPRPVERSPLRLAEIDQSVPRSGESLIRVSARGICRTDLHVCGGEVAVRRKKVTPNHWYLSDRTPCAINYSRTMSTRDRDRSGHFTHLSGGIIAPILST
jgi:hypothetical protein